MQRTRRAHKERGWPAAAERSGASAVLKLFPGEGASPPSPPPPGDPPAAAVRSRASSVFMLFPGKGAPPPPPGDPPAAPAPALVAVELGGGVIRDASDERILGVSNECNAGELGVTVEPVTEDMPSGTAESKFEPGVTVEPKVDVIPGGATQGNTHPADRPGDTAKRKIARERQGRGGRPDPGAREGNATVGRGARRTACRGGFPERPGVAVKPVIDGIPGGANQGGRPKPGVREGDAIVGRSTRRTARRGGNQAPSCLARGQG
jgi:hypothetical protein